MQQQLASQIGKLTSSLESLVAQLERDKALARAMKSSVQLQQFLAGEAESVANDAEKGQSDSGIGSGVGSGMSTTRKGMKKMMVQSPQELADLLEEFKQMDYVEDEDSIPQGILKIYVCCLDVFLIAMQIQHQIAPLWLCTAFTKQPNRPSFQENFPRVYTTLSLIWIKLPALLLRHLLDPYLQILHTRLRRRQIGGMLTCKAGLENGWLIWENCHN